MLRTQTANLPPEQQQWVHADFLANEQVYLKMRDGLLSRCRGQWVAIQDMRVIAFGDDLLAVTEAAAAGDGHPYIAEVGDEEAVIFRLRRTEFSSPYLTGLSSGAAGRPVTTLVFRGKAEVNGRRAPAFIQPMAPGHERLVGRDVLNHHQVLFDGPGGKVVFQP